MPCADPYVSVLVPGTTRNGKPCRKFLGKASRVFSGELLTQRVSKDRVALIPCKQCNGCRLDYSRQWAVRLMHETKSWETSSFLTLTYDDDHVVNSLDPDRIRTFNYDLRRRLAYRDLGKYKFFAVGEYGDRTMRAHYHLIIFGGPFGETAKHSHRQEPSRSGGRQWSNDHIGAVWPDGLHRISEVTFESAAYVARYSLKKITGAAARSHYGDRTPEFMRCSQGLGKAFAETWRSDIYPAGTVVMPGRGEFTAPKYYDRLLEREDPDLLSRTKSERSRNRRYFETVDEYLTHSKRRSDEGRVLGLKAKATLKREGVK